MSRRHLATLLRRFALAGFLFTGVTIGAFSLTVPSAFAATPGTPQVRCVTQTPPKHWVILDEYTDLNQCLDGPPINNVMKIAPPPSVQTVVCAFSPVPPGFAVTQEGKDFFHCRGLSFENNIKSITPVNQQTPSLDVCADSLIPDGFVVTAEHDLLSLPLEQRSVCSVQGSQLIQKTIAYPTGTGMNVCVESHIPPGYKEVGVGASSTCFLSNGASRFIVPKGFTFAQTP